VSLRLVLHHQVYHHEGQQQWGAADEFFAGVGSPTLNLSEATHTQRLSNIHSRSKNNSRGSTGCRWDYQSQGAVASY